MQPLTHAQAVTIYIYIYPDWLQSILATHSLHQRIFFRQGRQGHVSTKAYCQLYLLLLQQRKQEEHNNSNLHKQAPLKQCRLSICHSFHSTVVFSQRLTLTQHGSPPYTTASFKCTYTHLSSRYISFNTLPSTYDR